MLSETWKAKEYLDPFRRTEQPHSQSKGQGMVFVPGSHSLGASVDAGQLDDRFNQVLYELFSQASFQDDYLTLFQNLYPFLVYEVEPHLDLHGEIEDDPAYDAFTNRLYWAFEDTVLEDGYDHPAENILKDSLAQNGDEARKWITNVVLNTNKSAFGASVLRCLGRIDVLGNRGWKSDLIEKALGSDSIELRDAAVQAVESWEDMSLLSLLQRHEESVPWLKDYVEQVIQDFSE